MTSVDASSVKYQRRPVGSVESNRIGSIISSLIGNLSFRFFLLFLHRLEAHVNRARTKQHFRTDGTDLPIMSPVQS